MEQTHEYNHFLQAIIGWVFWQFIVFRRQKKTIDINKDGIVQGKEISAYLWRNIDNIILSLLGTYFALPLMPFIWSQFSEMEMWHEFYMFTAVIGVIIQEALVMIDPKAIAGKLLKKIGGSEGEQE